jgi:hypothetical protein
MAPLRWVSPFLFRPPDPFMLLVCLLLQWLSPSMLPFTLLLMALSLPMYVQLLIQCQHRLATFLRLITNTTILTLWFIAMFHRLLDSLFHSIDWCVGCITKTTRPPPRLKPTRRPPWRFHSLGYPASWLILSSLMLPASTITAFQTEFSLKSTRLRHLYRPRMPTFETVLNSPGWSPPTERTSASGEPIPDSCPPPSPFRLWKRVCVLLSAPNHWKLSGSASEQHVLVGHRHRHHTRGRDSSHL